jgi:hypothetical protein
MLDRVGWLVGSAVRPLIFFDLLIFWVKNGLEAPYMKRYKIMIRTRSHCKVRSGPLMEEEHVTNNTIIL